MPKLGSRQRAIAIFTTAEVPTCWFMARHTFLEQRQSGLLLVLLDAHFGSYTLSEEATVVDGDGSSDGVGFECSSSESPLPSAFDDGLSTFESLCSGSNFTLLRRSKSSYLRRRSSSSRSGNRCFRRRAICAAGTHCTLALTQFAHGYLRSHLTLRCWHNTHESIRGGFDDTGGLAVSIGTSGTRPSGVGSKVDMTFNTVSLNCANDEVLNGSFHSCPGL